MVTNETVSFVTPFEILQATAGEAISQRGLWDIIWGCFVTIFACTWIAVHPNLPAPEDGWWKIIRRRFFIMGCAIIAPELVLIWAMRQWYCSRKIAQSYSDRNWSQTHGFFVQMGGFMLVKDGKELQTLSLSHLEYLHNTGRIDFPKITRKQIWDKSKGDALSKALVIFQTTWFTVQCIARGIQGMFITELEILTLGFAALNGVMYFLWWRKPLDVECPYPVILLPENTEPPTAASGNEQPRSRPPPIPNRSEVDWGDVREEVRIATNAPNLRTVLMPNFSEDSFGNSLDSCSSPEGPGDSTHTGACDHDIGTESRDVHVRPMHPPRAFIMPSSRATFNDVGIGDGQQKYVSPSVNLKTTAITSEEGRQQDFGILQFVSSIIATIHAFLINALLTFLQTVSEMIGSRDGFEPGARRVPTFYAGEVTNRKESLLMGSAASILATAFGGIHCIAWNFRFPTTVEKHLWQAGSLAITCIPAVFFIVFVVGWYSNSTNRHITVFLFLAGYIENVIVIIYVVARLCLLAQAVVLLRLLPPDAYDAVQWTRFVPHL